MLGFSFAGKRLNTVKTEVKVTEYFKQTTEMAFSKETRCWMTAETVFKAQRSRTLAESDKRLAHSGQLA